MATRISSITSALLVLKPREGGELRWKEEAEMIVCPYCGHPNTEGFAACSRCLINLEWAAQNMAPFDPAVREGRMRRETKDDLVAALKPHLQGGERVIECTCGFGSDIAGVGQLATSLCTSKGPSEGGLLGERILIALVDSGFVLLQIAGEGQGIRSEGTARRVAYQDVKKLAFEDIHELGRLMLQSPSDSLAVAFARGSWHYDAALSLVSGLSDRLQGVPVELHLSYFGDRPPKGILACPHCGRAIEAQSSRCPFCQRELVTSPGREDSAIETRGDVDAKADFWSREDVLAGGLGGALTFLIASVLMSPILGGEELARYSWGMRMNLVLDGAVQSGAYISWLLLALVAFALGGKAGGSGAQNGEQRPHGTWNLGGDQIARGAVRGIVAGAVASPILFAFAVLLLT